MLNKTGLFAVTKGDDIRIVYDDTKCLLNAAPWFHSLYLLETGSILKNVDSYTWFGDIDIGEMFLNDMLYEELRPYYEEKYRIVFKYYAEPNA